jgi:hypothetical protein
MVHTLSVGVDVSILPGPWFSVGHSATFVHGEDGLRTLTTQAQFLSTCYLGLTAHLLSVRTTLTLIVLEMTLAPLVVALVLVLRL